MKLYKATTYGNRINEIDVIRVTEASYYELDWKRRERRNALTGSGFKCFEKPTDAVDWLRTELKRRVDSYKSMVEYAEANLNTFTEKYPENETE